MTTKATATDADPQQDDGEEDPRYTIEPALIESQGRSVPVVVVERLCDEALAKLKSPGDWRKMSYPQIRRLARDNCRKQEDYLSARQPVRETIFRMLLVAQTGSMSLGDIHETLSGLWTTSPWPRHIGIEALRRVLDNATDYGIVQVETK